MICGRTHLKTKEQDVGRACRALHLSPSCFKHVCDLCQIRSENFSSAVSGLITGAQTQEVRIGLRFWLWLNDNPLPIQLPDCPAAGNYCGAITQDKVIQVRSCSQKKNYYLLS